jgi:hypothetical protein
MTECVSPDDLKRLLEPRLLKEVGALDILFFRLIDLIVYFCVGFDDCFGFKGDPHLSGPQPKVCLRQIA